MASNPSWARSTVLSLVLFGLSACPAPPPGSGSPDGGSTGPSGADASLDASALADAAAAPDAAPNADADAGGGGDAPDAAGSSSADASAPDAGPCSGSRTFEVGAGIYDVTGPVAEVGMMGYAQVSQKTAGLHSRLWSRAFVVASPCNGQRVALVTAELGQIFQGVHQQVLERLAERYGDLYRADNVLLNATHTHSGPGGYSHYALYNLTTFGFIPQSFEAAVHGIVQSVVRAHESLEPATLRLATGEVADTGLNRSPLAYEANPAEERALYEADTDRKMTHLRFDALDGREIGALNWFAVHGTSMGNQNRLISGDNKGQAAYLFERSRGPFEPDAPGRFVGAFAQANSGDVSPNVFGGTDGGGADDFESTAISAGKQLAAALSLHASAGRVLEGGVDARQTFVKMDAVSLPDPGGQARTTCPAAIGVSMIAGAEDGPGYGSEGATCESLSWLVSGLTCSGQRTECQAEKPVVLETGTRRPYPWTPEVLPFQVVRIGPLAVLALPFEVTTMSGRRLRAAVGEELGPLAEEIVVSGLSNAYTGYLATREEYAVQNYEGASTHFGPWTLEAVEQQARLLAAALRDGAAVEPGPAPRDLREHQTTVQPGVVVDAAPVGKAFGDVEEQPLAEYQRGETARAVFWGAHPNNDLRRQGSYLAVQRLEPSGDWVDVARDWDWETRLVWERVNCLPTLACSRIAVEWSIPADAAPGTYRIVHDGTSKALDGTLTQYRGVSQELAVR